MNIECVLWPETTMYASTEQLWRLWLYEFNAFTHKTWFRSWAKNSRTTTHMDSQSIEGKIYYSFDMAHENFVNMCLWIFRVIRVRAHFWTFFKLQTKRTKWNLHMLLISSTKYELALIVSWTKNSIDAYSSALMSQVVLHTRKCRN